MEPAGLDPRHPRLEELARAFNGSQQPLEPQDLRVSGDLRREHKASGAVAQARRVPIHDERQARGAQLLHYGVERLVLYARDDGVKPLGDSRLHDVEDGG